MNKGICSSFGLCASCVLSADYETQKARKIQNSKELFAEFFAGEFEFFETNEIGFRTRAEFRLWHNESGVHYAMSGFDKKPVIIKNCAIVNEKISSLMPKLLEKINKNEALKSKIFGCEFVSSKHSLCAILLYHKDIELIKTELESLAKQLQITLIARSKGKKLVFGTSDISSDILDDEIVLKNSVLRYKISPDGFIQPNASTNAKMLGFVISKLENSAPLDLCELYCGLGNFSIALAPYFRAVLATEINKHSIDLARQNAALNNAKNVIFARLSASEFSEALKGVREFNRLKGVDLKSFEFSHILVDPPRAGCDESVLALMREFRNIIYISCSQSSLKRDLNFLKNTHKITHFALFDQFAHTEHIESICLLEKF